jgi:glucokinase
VSFLQEPHFVQTFARKGRFKDLMERIPIHVITTRAALLGAAIFGLQSLNNVKKRDKERASLAAV